MLILKREPARQLVDNADLSWNWSALWAVFVLKAGPSWVKLNLHEWKRPWGFTVQGLSIKQTNKQTNKIEVRTELALGMTLLELHATSFLCPSRRWGRGGTGGASDIVKAKSSEK